MLSCFALLAVLGSTSGIFLRKCNPDDLKGNLSSYNDFFDDFVSTGACINEGLFQTGERANSVEVKFSANPTPVKIDNKSEVVFANEFSGPESMAVDGDTAYAGAADGYIYKIDLKTRTASRLTTACDVPGVTQCRPQGIRVCGGSLYFADSAGLLTYDFQTGNVSMLLKRLSVIDREPLTLPNDIDISSDCSRIFMSDGSTKYPNTVILCGTLLRDKNGRVIDYDVKQKKASVLVKGLSFPNGIQLAQDGKSLMVNVFNEHKVIRVEINGNSKGSYKTFAKDLPGEPDNIRASADGGYYLGMNLARSGSQRAFYDELADAPCAAERFVKMKDMVADFLQFLGDATANPIYAPVYNELKSCHFVSETASRIGLVVKLNGAGKEIERLQSDEYPFISQALPYQGGLLIGSDRTPGALFYNLTKA